VVDSSKFSVVPDEVDSLVISVVPDEVDGAICEVISVVPDDVDSVVFSVGISVVSVDEVVLVKIGLVVPVFTVDDSIGRVPSVTVVPVVDGLDCTVPVETDSRLLVNSVSTVRENFVRCE